MGAMDQAATTASLTLAPTLPRVGARSAHPTPEQAMRTAKEFASVFLAQFTGIMFSGVKSDGLLGAGPGEDIYKSMLARQYGKALAQSGNFGIADSVYREIMKTQEVE